ncbi:MAG: hypothetical protein M1834_002373 [Cirrosporium novae-zelandiae]|nr:MAG: hypothetical protein M1834_002373 [Cirrosporium novae-zelandiae]
MGILDYIESSAGWLFLNYKHRDSKLFFKGPAFTDFPEPTFELIAPDCGPSNSFMKDKYTQVGPSLFPELKWSIPSDSPEVKEYIIIIEDPDVPLPWPVYHGLFYSVPAERRGVTNEDFELVEDDTNAEKPLKSGFKFIKNIRGSHYIGPRPLLDHGPHRYIYEVIALKEPLDIKPSDAKSMTREQVADAIVGKVAGWGMWVGVFERKWQNRVLQSGGE